MIEFEHDKDNKNKKVVLKPYKMNDAADLSEACLV